MTNRNNAERESGQGLSAADLFEPEIPWVIGLTILVGLVSWSAGVFDGLPEGNAALPGVIGGGLCAWVLRPIVRLALRIAQRRALERAYSRRCGRRA
ncbi:hypothetical protein [Pseudodesulfovibrio pelocollis]|uniref:hypothetical protein n=1 Tax=Pseudodesulfovibrio pelocollis TaxID=3051432 RepID=UPI00255ADCC8|nr:hypothetical protein [Pseudodesulfovibrio sp. SB368]